MMRKPMNEGLRRYDALGNDVTETGDVTESRRVVAEHEQMLSDLGLSAEATQEEINEARARKNKEVKYEEAKEYIAEYEANASALGETEPKPEQPTAEETRKYEEAKAIVAAYETPETAPVEQPATQQSWR